MEVANQEKVDINEEEIDATDEDEDEEDGINILSSSKPSANKPSRNVSSAPRTPSLTATASSSSTSLEGSNVGNAEKYLAPSEVEAQIKLLWQNQGDMLNYIWRRNVAAYRRNSLASSSGATKEDSEYWRVFFVRAVLVPPNRFRPMAKVGEAVSPHPQSIHLTRILQLNMKIRLLQNGVDIRTFEKESYAAQQSAASAAKAARSIDPSTPKSSSSQIVQVIESILSWRSNSHAID